jgi:hypothetical protein
MRDYGSVSPQFWIGRTGKGLRGQVEAQLVALYLMTSPHANMIGVFYCPLDYIAKETGLGMEGASKGLQCLIEAQFCRFDEASEEVFVARMAAFQIGEQLDPKDKRCIGVARELEKVSSDVLRTAFHALYSTAFHLPDPTPPETQKSARATEGASKPHRSQDQDQEQKQDQKQEPPSGFVRFWSAWPKHPRKGEKAECLKAWRKGGMEAVADAIVAHVERMKSDPFWTKDDRQFIPAPLTYLHKKRWDGADEDTAQPAQKDFI